MKVMKKVMFVLLVVFIAVVYSNSIWPRAIYNTNIGSSSYEDTGLLEKGAVIEQQFRCSDLGFCGFSMKITKLDNQEIGTYKWSIFEVDSGELIGEGTLDENATKNRNFESSNPQKRGIVRFDFPKQQESKGKTYILRIQADQVSEEKSMAIYVTEKNESENVLMINGQKSDQASVINLQYKRFNFETFIVFLGIMCYLAAFIKFMYKLFR